jgi:uncharacterized RmlC-like cupin family protein
MKEANEPIPQIIHGEDIGKQAGQTHNLHRFVPVDPERMHMKGPSRIFFGRAIPLPHATPPHYGEAETAGYVLSGRCRIYYRPGYKEYVTERQGDFMYVPPHIQHIEVNQEDEPFIGIVARSPENIVVNLDDQTPPPLR